MAEAYYVAGRNSVRELLRSSNVSRAKKMFVARGTKGAEELQRLAIKHRIPVEETHKSKLSSLVGSDSHQGVVLLASPPQSENFRDFVERMSEEPSSLLLALDAVYDPQNLGSILRAAECFGVDGVLWSRNRGAGVTPVVTKASVGATELVNILQVSNLSQSLQKLKDAGYWIVVADGSSDSEPLTGFSFPEKAVIVLGSEGEGVSSLLLKQADFRIQIPMSGSIDSLNVSQAAAVFLFAARISG